MGTLQHQEPRWEKITEDGIKAQVIEFKNIAKEMRVSYENVLATAKFIATINDYDAKDEQLKGFGDLLEGTMYQLNKIASALEEK